VVRQGGSPSFFIAGQPHCAFSGTDVASLHEPAAQGRLLLVRDSFKSRGPKYPPGSETEFRIFSDFLSQMAMARAKGGSGIENIDHAKRERGSHARRTPKKKAFSQLRKETMVRTPSRDSVFASLPGCGLRLIAFQRVPAAPFFNRATTAFFGRGFFVWLVPFKAQSHVGDQTCNAAAKRTLHRLSSHA
jgi:hypothetical protein